VTKRESFAVEHRSTRKNFGRFLCRDVLKCMLTRPPCKRALRVLFAGRSHWDLMATRTFCRKAFLITDWSTFHHSWAPIAEIRPIFRFYFNFRMFFNFHKGQWKPWNFVFCICFHSVLLQIHLIILEWHCYRLLTIGSFLKKLFALDCWRFTYASDLLINNNGLVFT